MRDTRQVGEMLGQKEEYKACKQAKLLLYLVFRRSPNVYISKERKKEGRMENKNEKS